VIFVSAAWMLTGLTTRAPGEPLPTSNLTVGSAFQIGMASYYGAAFHDRVTASGERFDTRAMTAAHRTLPFGTRVRVTNLQNGRTVVVRINDRGPFVKGRVLDLSRAAARELRLLARGTERVRLEVLAANDRPGQRTMGERG
jgi:rare lipoprotein A